MYPRPAVSAGPHPQNNSALRTLFAETCTRPQSPGLGREGCRACCTTRITSPATTFLLLLSCEKVLTPHDVAPYPQRRRSLPMLANVQLRRSGPVWIKMICRKWSWKHRFDQRSVQIFNGQSPLNMQQQRRNLQVLARTSWHVPVRAHPKMKQRSPRPIIMTRRTTENPLRKLRWVLGRSASLSRSRACQCSLLLLVVPRWTTIQ